MSDKTQAVVMLGLAIFAGVNAYAGTSWQLWWTFWCGYSLRAAIHYAVDAWK